MVEPIRLYLDEDTISRALIRALLARLHGKSAKDMENWLEFLSQWR